MMIRSILTITCVLVLVAVGYPAGNKLQDKPDTVFKGQFIQPYSKLPVFFEPSQNKTTGDANFISRGLGYLLSLSPGEARFLLISHDVAVNKHSSSKAAFLRMHFIDGNPSPDVKGYKLLLGKSNYLLGNDRKKWRTNIPHYAEVHYKGVYPGIDLVYHGSQDCLEYDFMVAPGADPAVIRIAFQGADELAIDGDGNLILRTAVGDILMRRPNAYQEVDGVSKQIYANYTLKGKEQVAFAVGDYDAKKPLVIDPEVAYATYLGGTGSDQALAVALGSDGSVYLTGGTNSGKSPGDMEDDFFPTTPGGLGGDVDAFVTKFDADGHLVYSSYLGGGGRDNGNGIAVDDNGYAYVTGLTASGGDFGPIFPGVVNNKTTGDLVCLGEATEWDRVCLDVNGNLACVDDYYITEDMACKEAPDDLDCSILTDTVPDDMNCSETASLCWHQPPAEEAWIWGCVPTEEITSAMICLDQPDQFCQDEATEDMACITGMTFSKNFPITSLTAYQTESSSCGDVFVTCYQTPVYNYQKNDWTGKFELLYSTFLGGSGLDDREIRTMAMIW